MLDDLLPTAPEQSYAVAGNGEKILIVEPVDQEAGQHQITVILNWLQTLPADGNSAR